MYLLMDGKIFGLRSCARSVHQDQGTAKLLILSNMLLAFAFLAGRK